MLNREFDMAHASHLVLELKEEPVISLPIIVAIASEQEGPKERIATQIIGPGQDIASRFFLVERKQFPFITNDPN